MNNNTNVANREVCDLTFCEFKTKVPFLYVDYANTSTTELTGETTFAYGGKGHPKKIAFNGEKGGTISFETQIQTMKLYSFLTGAAIESTANFIKREEVTCAEAGKLNVVSNPVLGSINIFSAEDDCGAPLVCTIASAAAVDPATGYILTCTVEDGGSVPAKDSKYVVYYIETISTKVKKLNIKSTTFPKIFVAYADTFDVAEDGTVIQYKMTAYKCVPQSNFSLGFSNNGDPASLTITCDLMTDENDNMLDIIMQED